MCRPDFENGSHQDLPQKGYLPVIAKNGNRYYFFIFGQKVGSENKIKKINEVPSLCRTNEKKFRSDIALIQTIIYFTKD